MDANVAVGAAAPAVAPDVEVESLTGRSLLFVAHDVPYFLSHRLPIALRARELGMRIGVAAPGAPASVDLRQLGFQLHDLPFKRGGKNPLFELRTLAALVRILKRERPDIVHAVALKMVAYTSLVARALGLRAICALTGLGYVFTENTGPVRAVRACVVSLLRRSLGGSRTLTIFQNPDDLALFESLGVLRRENAVLIRGSGVNTSTFTPAPVPPGDPVVVLPGRILRHKGVGEFVEAARRLRAEGIAARFVLVGGRDDDNPATYAVGDIQAWVDSGIVEWWGHRTDMPEVYRQASIVCLPSYREGLPKALLEAAATGRALVATDVPGCREAIEVGGNGLLVPVQDPASLADALRQLLVDVGLRDRFAAESRKMAVSDFSVEGVAEQTVRAYRRLLAMP